MDVVEAVIQGLVLFQGGILMVCYSFNIIWFECPKTIFLYIRIDWCLCSGRWVTMSTSSLEAWRNYGLYPKEEWHHSMAHSKIIRRYSNHLRKVTFCGCILEDTWITFFCSSSSQLSYMGIYNFAIYPNLCISRQFYDFMNTRLN